MRKEVLRTLYLLPSWDSLILTMSMTVSCLESWLGWKVTMKSNSIGSMSVLVLSQKDETGNCDGLWLGRLENEDNPHGMETNLRGWQGYRSCFYETSLRYGNTGRAVYISTDKVQNRMGEMRIFSISAQHTAFPSLGTVKAWSGASQCCLEQLHRSSSRDHGAQRELTFPGHIAVPGVILVGDYGCHSCEAILGPTGMCSRQFPGYWVTTRLGWDRTESKFCRYHSCSPFLPMADEAGGNLPYIVNIVKYDEYYYSA